MSKTNPIQVVYKKDASGTYTIIFVDGMRMVLPSFHSNKKDAVNEAIDHVIELLNARRMK